MNATHTTPGIAAGLDRARQRALIIGVGALVLSAVGAVTVVGVERSLFSYLTAFVFWIGIALGCLAIGMLHQLTGGAWGVPIRRPLEAAMGTLPLMAVLFIPLALTLGRIYAWAQPETVAGDHILELPNSRRLAGENDAAETVLVQDHGLIIRGIDDQVRVTQGFGRCYHRLDVPRGA